MPGEVDWARLWAARPLLLRIARRHSAGDADAEDAVGDALLRAAEAGPLERPEAWLTRVTLNRCVDAARDRARAPRRCAYAVVHALPEPGPDEVVADRAEAVRVAAVVDLLPRPQREALWLVADGLSVGQAASRMALSYKAVESLLARARATVRKSTEGSRSSRRRTG